MFQTLQEVLTLRLGITVLQRSCGKKGGKPTLLTSLFPPLFSDMLPLDLLSFVLERDPSKLVPGVHMKQAGGVRGVHFSSPHSSLSFPSSQLLANCDLFPKEFSIVVTLKVTHIAQKVNICGNPDIVTSVRGTGGKNSSLNCKITLNSRAKRKKGFFFQFWVILLSLSIDDFLKISF